MIKNTKQYLLHDNSIYRDNNFNHLAGFIIAIQTFNSIFQLNIGIYQYILGLLKLKTS